MPPRGLTNPAPKTESAREARKSFFCELCSKGYSRMNEFEAHESSYDHQHKKRLKEMKQMQRDPLASTKARKAERKADEKSGLITIKPVKLDAQPASVSTGFKKGGFKNAFGGDAVAKREEDGERDDRGGKGSKKVLGKADEDVPLGNNEVESDTEDEGYEYYDPSRPTDCYEACPGR
ncbi:Zinc finger, double-stranded RNA binding [Lasallia pustulata]|uniref:Zinc finger, double-stranded RNA binding n=1 Tax=Lasallia pustulata TaxID=136370 RepID=A0A1W5CUH1_9LECA|nr:Zinc finger, double-stranded RNA binding [Lasallia pustulata]